ncbi:hypothetical protein E2C16_05560 [Sporosarcina pasteurii]|uniref:Integral membrane protein n=1 Tax=Sporosarcina pasteurii TaxID=1474 RepID=A0A380BQN5_SPOPA|nr:hypothetical protein [Sporosarcina pasteurii]QBQ05168.1 hypothetical protein E2C16_05560 [Sporosarcina pasteurii]SUJ05483.1 Uncharacterised protein [Sporosarcina pasteurii]
MAFIVSHQWGIFIIIEILSLVSLLLFGVFRYFLNKRKVSTIMILTFIALLLLEGLLAILVYTETNEISTFQIVVLIFILYACTFGVLDFLKLDRWMRKKVGEWRGTSLLTEKDTRILKRQKNSKYVAKKYRISSMTHTVIFIAGQWLLWSYGTNHMSEMLPYIKDWSWFTEGRFEASPYANETAYHIGVLWIIVFAVDFIYSWSYTLFPKRKI